MKKFLRLAVMIGVVLFSLTGCFWESTKLTDPPESPNPPEGTSYVSVGKNNNISYSIKQGDYVVENFNIVKAYSTLSWIYGVLKVKYIGTNPKISIRYTIDFKDKDGDIIFKEESYLWNITSAYVTSTGYCTETFVNQEYNIAYGNIIENLADYGKTIEDIAYADITIEEGYDFGYEIPVEKLEKSGEPVYDAVYDSWKQPIISKVNGTIKTTFSEFIFSNGEGQPVSWTYPSSLNSYDEYDYEFEYGEKGYLRSLRATPDYEKKPYSLENVLLAWYMPDISSTSKMNMSRVMNSSYLSEDEKNSAISKLIYEENQKLEENIVKNRY